MLTPDRIMKLVVALLILLSVALFADLMPMDDQVLATADRHHRMADDCVKPDGILVGLKSLFFCPAPNSEDKPE